MKVLIAVEDTAHGGLMTEFVRKHDWAENNEFVVLHVIEPILLNHSGEIAYLRLLESSVAEITKQAKVLTEKIAWDIRLACPKATVTETLAEGHVASTILDVAKDQKVDLMIVGSHGRKGLNRFFMGSVSETIMSHAPCSLVILRLPDQAITEEPSQSQAVVNSR